MKRRSRKFGDVLAGKRKADFGSLRRSASCLTRKPQQGMGDPAFVKRFRHAERPGLYCRVIEEGDVQAGDPVSIERTQGPTENVITLFREFFAGKQSAERMRYLLTLPIDIRSRNYYEQELAKLAASPDA